MSFNFTGADEFDSGDVFNSQTPNKRRHMIKQCQMAREATDENK